MGKVSQPPRERVARPRTRTKGRHFIDSVNKSTIEDQYGRLQLQAHVAEIDRARHLRDLRPVCRLPFDQYFSTSNTSQLVELALLDLEVNSQSRKGSGTRLWDAETNAKTSVKDVKKFYRQVIVTQSC